jgi:hypothetical protein
MPMRIGRSADKGAAVADALAGASSWTPMIALSSVITGCRPSRGAPSANGLAP